MSSEASLSSFSCTSLTSSLWASSSLSLLLLSTTKITAGEHAHQVSHWFKFSTLKNQGWAQGKKNKKTWSEDIWVTIFLSLSLSFFFQRKSKKKKQSSGNNWRRPIPEKWRALIFISLLRKFLDKEIGSNKVINMGKFVFRKFCNGCDGFLVLTVFCHNFFFWNRFAWNMLYTPSKTSHKHLYRRVFRLEKLFHPNKIMENNKNWIMSWLSALKH